MIATLIILTLAASIAVAATRTARSQERFADIDRLARRDRRKDTRR